MKKVEDFILSARTVHDRYSLGRMDREIVRNWVLGLGDYPHPHGPAVVEAKTWFRKSDDGADPVELKIADLARLHHLYSPGH